MDQLQGVRTLIDRLGLPPRMKMLVEGIEAADGPLGAMGPTPGGLEVRRIHAMVDGVSLLSCIVAAMLNHIEPTEEALAADVKVTDTRTPYTRWLQASEKFPDALVLLLVDETYLAFDGQAERIADALEEHLFNVDGKTGIALKEEHQPTWEAKMLDAQLDILLAAEAEEGDDGGPGYSTIRLLDEPPPNPLDHDGDGKPGGSLKGDESTAHKGAARKKAAAK